jgi:sugar transferase EpsL
MYVHCMKRFIDIMVSLFALILLLPILGILYCVVFFFLGSSAIFQQKRAGFRGRPFVIYKFRTMNDFSDENGDLLPDNLRLTRLGNFLRKASLDELPGLWNVLKGDMSLVGPRPLCLEYLPLYSKIQARRHDVNPGITGWAQVNGRNAISWEEKFKLDVWYVDNVSFLLDIKILWLTIFKVLFARGVNQEGQATMERFMGTHEH